MVPQATPDRPTLPPRPSPPIAGAERPPVAPAGGAGGDGAAGQTEPAADAAAPFFRDLARRSRLGYAVDQGRLLCYCAANSSAREKTDDSATAAVSREALPR